MSDLRTAVEIALERHELETRLRERERWFATTLRSIGDAVMCTDLEGGVSFMNARAETLTGWSFADALGRPFRDVLSLDEGIGQLVEAAGGRGAARAAWCGAAQRGAALRSQRASASRRRQRGADPGRREGARSRAGVPRSHREARTAAPARVRRPPGRARHDGGRRRARGEQPARGDRGEPRSPVAGARGQPRGRAARDGDGRRDLARGAQRHQRARRIACAGSWRTCACSPGRPTTARGRAISAWPALGDADHRARVPAPRACGGESRRGATGRRLGGAPRAGVREPAGQRRARHRARPRDGQRGARGDEHRRSRPRGGRVQRHRRGDPAPRSSAAIFDPFFTTKPRARYRARPLGLPRHRDLARRQHPVESEPGKGTCFRVVLPPAVAIDEAAAPPATAPTTRGTGARILVIDDEPLVRRAIERSLENEHEVVAVAPRPRRSPSSSAASASTSCCAT